MKTTIKIELGTTNTVEIVGDFKEALTLLTVMMNRYPYIKQMFSDAIAADDAFIKHQADKANQAKQN